MSNIKYKVVLFDLDGTLLDTSKGIHNSVRFAEKQLNLPHMPQECLNAFIGPPPMVTYQKIYGLSESEAMEATKCHRQYGLNQGAYEAEIYKGIPLLLEQLKARGFLLGVCTLKRQDIAETVLKHFQLSDYFNVIVGIDSGEKLNKSDTIEIALKKIHYVDKETTLLVGDSMYDADGAYSAGVDFIGVLYGFGFCTGIKYSFDTIEQPCQLMPILCNSE